MMPTDEQRMREAFEADVVASSPAGASLNFTQDGVGGYMSGFMHHRWLGWLAGLQARDAEVQRLLTALANMVAAFDDPFTTMQETAHENAVMLLAEYLPEKGTTDE